eukprot:3331573-Rhodomonas_salina.4
MERGEPGGRQPGGIHRYLMTSTALAIDLRATRNAFGGSGFLTRPVGVGGAARLGEAAYELNKDGERVMLIPSKLEKLRADRCTLNFEPET